METLASALLSKDKQEQVHLGAALTVVKASEEFDKLLTPEAKEINNHHIPSVVYKYVDGDKVKYVTFACLIKTVSLEDGESYPVECEKKMARVFNILVAKGLAKYGLLSPCSWMNLAMTGAQRKAAIFLFVFSDYNRDELNEKLGFKDSNNPLFVREGSVGSDDWSNIDTLLANN